MNSNQKKTLRMSGKGRWMVSLTLAGALVACGGELVQGELDGQESLGEAQAAVTSASPESLSADLTGDVARVYPEGQAVRYADADFLDLRNADLRVQKDNSEVFVTLVSTSSGNDNAIAYFTYSNGSPPTTPPTLSSSNIVFPSTKGVAPGTRVSLGVINTGLRVGLVVLINGGNPTSPNLSAPKYYSVPSLNPDGAHFVSKYHKAEMRRVVGVEDMALASADKDYNDVVVSVRSIPVEVQPDTYVVYNPDLDGALDGNTRTQGRQDCDFAAGEVTTGFQYRDLPSRDWADAAIMQCTNRFTGASRWLGNGDYDHVSSGTTWPAMSCGSSTLQGISYKEAQTTTAPYSDFMDGLTLFCTGSSSGNLANSDVDTNTKTFRTLTCRPGSTMVGWIGKDTPTEWGNSDALDGMSIVCQND